MGLFQALDSIQLDVNSLRMPIPPCTKW